MIFILISYVTLTIICFWALFINRRILNLNKYLLANQCEYLNENIKLEIEIKELKEKLSEINQKNLQLLESVKLIEQQKLVYEKENKTLQNELMVLYVKNEELNFAFKSKKTASDFTVGDKVEIIYDAKYMDGTTVVEVDKVNSAMGKFGNISKITPKGNIFVSGLPENCYPKDYRSSIKRDLIFSPYQLFNLTEDYNNELAQ